MSLSFALVDVSGTAHALDESTGVLVLMGERGLGMPSYEVAEDKLPYAPGTTLRRVITPAKMIELPVEIVAATSALLDARLDTVRAWLIPGTERRSTPGTVYLQVTRADGAEREIEAVYLGGLEGDGAVGVETWHDAVLTLRAPDPYWRDVAETVVTFTSGAGVRSWWPYYPYDLTASAVYAAEPITNGGQIEAWPVWTITGPGTDPTLTNLTTGESLTLEGVTLAPGQVLTIDTSERGSSAKSIVDNNGANYWPFVPIGSAMWPLEVGINNIRIQLSNTTPASSVELSYRRRWAGGDR